MAKKSILSIPPQSMPHNTCVMIESNKFYIVERKDFRNGTYIDKIKKWLTM